MQDQHSTEGNAASQPETPAPQEPEQPAKPMPGWMTLGFWQGKGNVAAHAIEDDQRLAMEDSVGSPE